MKYFTLSAIVVFSLNTFASNGKISLKCEEGVGNRSNPIQFVHIEGVVSNPDNRGLMSEEEKQLLKVSISVNQEMVELNNNEYKISVEDNIDKYSGGTGLIVTMLTDKSRFTQFQIVEAGGPELLVKAIGASAFTGSQKVINSGLCWGFSPFK